MMDAVPCRLSAIGYDSSLNVVEGWPIAFVGHSCGSQADGSSFIEVTVLGHAAQQQPIIPSWSTSESLSLTCEMEVSVLFLGRSAEFRPSNE